MKRVVLKTNEAVAYQGGAMESGDHFKNGASSKSQLSRGNIFKIIFFALLVASAVFSGCQKDDNVLPPEEDDEMVTVGMKAVGELVGTESPLTKSDDGAKPLWGLQVWVATEQGNPYYWDATKVAHGVFDNLSKITLTLNKNRKYCIEATYMPNGQNEIHSYGTGWGYPFAAHGGAGATPINQVIYSTSVGIGGMWDGQSHLVNASNPNSYHEAVDRYYGFVEEYTPVEGGIIDIYMTRTVFGLTFVGTKVDGFTYDNLVVQLDADYYPKVHTLNVDNSQPTSQLVIPFICMKEVRRSALENNYVETFKVSVGTEENPALIFYGDVNVKRNTMHTYTFNMETDDVDGGVNPIFDDDEMDNETEDLKDLE